MGPDNAVFAGPWMLLFWPHEGGISTIEEIRVCHVIDHANVIDLTGGDWACHTHEFSRDGQRLDLKLMNSRTGDSASGSFDMTRGVWTPAITAAPLSSAEFHERFGSASRTIDAWPDDPFRHARPPGSDDVLSPDGTFRVDLTTNRWRMSDWIHPARIVHVPSGATLLDLATTYWNCRARFTGAHVVELTLLKYPDVKPLLTIELDLAAERYRVIEGDPTFAREGYIDVLQRELGRPQEDLDELNIRINVAESRRPGDAPRDTSETADERDTDDAAELDELNELEELADLEASEAAATAAVVDADVEDDEDDDEEDLEPPEFSLSSPVSSDGAYRLEFDASEVSPPLWIERLRITMTTSNRVLFDLTSAEWDCEAAWIGECNMLRLKICTPRCEQRLIVKIDLDCMLYWEEEGPDLGQPGGVLAAPVWELQQRLTAERGVIHKAERSGATGSMWPAASFGGPGLDAAAASLPVTPNIPAPSAASPVTPASVPAAPDFMRLVDLLRLAGEKQMPAAVIQTLSVALMVQTGSITPEAGAAQLKLTVGNS